MDLWLDFLKIFNPIDKCQWISSPNFFRRPWYIWKWLSYSNLKIVRIKKIPCIWKYSVGLTLSTLFSQLFRFRVVLSRWTYYKKFYFAETRKNVIYSKLVNNHFNKYFLKNEKLWFTRLFHLKIYLQFPFLTCVSYACLISV